MQASLSFVLMFKKSTFLTDVRVMKLKVLSVPFALAPPTLKQILAAPRERTEG